MEKLGCFMKPLNELSAMSRMPAGHRVDPGLKYNSLQSESQRRTPQRREELSKESAEKNLSRNSEYNQI